MDYTGLDDQTLIRLITRADAEALSELYDRYNRLVYGLALATVGDHGTAEEVTLDVFVRVWSRAQTYRGDQAKVSTWLTSIVRNRAIDMLRHRSARPELQSLEWAETSSDALTRVSGPEEATELALQRRRVRAALAQLPFEQRQVLTLAYFKGYTQREIAEILEQPLGTVKTRIRLAMQKLQQLLQDEHILR